MLMTKREGAVVIKKRFLFGLVVCCSWIANGELSGPSWYNQTAEMVEPSASTNLGGSAFQTMAIGASIDHQDPLDYISDEIKVLARGLRYDVVEIYDYVQGTIEYIPYYGAQKGATQTLLDGCGNDFDQAALLSALLKESGFSPEYKYGTIFLEDKFNNPFSDIKDLFGVESQGVAEILGGGGIPALLVDSYPDPAYPAETINAYFVDRIWVSVLAEGVYYQMDPAYKKYEKIAAPDWSSMMGYSQSTLLTAGGGIDHNDYVQNLDTNALNTYLSLLSSQLLSAIETSYAVEEPGDVLGGYFFSPISLNDTGGYLPYSAVGTPTTWSWGGMPDDKLTTICFQCNGIDTTLATAELRGRRIALSFDSQDRAQLWLDDTLLATETSAVGSAVDLTITVNHPYSAAGGTYADHAETKAYQRSGAYAVVYNFGGIRQDGHLRKRQQKLDAYRAQGLAETSREVRSEALNVIGMNWLRQTGLATELIHIPANTLGISHHRVGRVGQEASYYIDVGLQLSSLVSRLDATDQTDAAFRAAALIYSAMEHGVLEQLQGADKPGVSTIQTFKLANQGGYKIYRLDSGNYSTYQAQLATTYPASQMSDFQTRINQGEILILPVKGDLSLNDWDGYGYIVQSADAMGMLISGGLSGAEGSVIAEVDSGSVQNKHISADNYFGHEPPTGSNPKSIEPVDLASGGYLYDAVDLSLGGPMPRGIAFRRNYNSLRSKVANTLGHGWRHNFESRITRRTNTEAAFGSTTPQAAATMMASAYACLDLMKNPTRAKEWVSASMIAYWATDQLLNNSVAVQFGEKTLEFIEQPDSSFLPPAGITASLDFTNGVYVLQQRLGNTFTFNSDQKLSSVMDVDGNELTIAYDAVQRPEVVTDEYGRTLTLHYDAANKLDKITDSTGRTVDYTYDANNDLVACADPEIHTTTFTYDSEHRMTELRNPKAEVIAKNIYNEMGQVKQQYAYGNTNQTWNFYYSGFRTIEATPEGGETHYHFDEKGRQVALEDTFGNKSTMLYDGQDHRVQTGDARGNITTFVFDNQHNMIRMVDAEGHTTTNGYDTLHRLVKTVQLERSAIYQTFYDSEHHVVKTIDPEGHEIDQTYWANGLRQTRTDQDNHTTTFAYDAYGMPDTTTFPDTTTIDQDFSVHGDLLRMEDANGNATTFTYDKRRLLTSAMDALGGTVSNVYDQAGNLEWTRDKNFSETTFTYSAQEKRISTTYDDGYSITNLYDLADRIVAVADSLGLVMSNQYDLAGRVVHSEDVLGRAISNRYDSASNLLETTDPLLRSTSFVYDDLNRPYRTTNAMDKVSTESFDASGNRDSLETYAGSNIALNYDLRNFQTNRVSHEGRETVWHYNERGLLSETTEPSGEKTITTFNTMGRATQVDYKNAAGASVSIQTVDYDDNGNITELAEGNRTTFYGYDSLNRLTNIAYAVESGGLPLPGGGGSTPVEIGYAYNANNQLSELTYPDGKTVDYRYDNRNRLKEVEDWNNRITTYFYDLRGRLTGVQNPNGTSRTNHYDSADQLKQIHDTDAQGGLICQYDLDYDAAGRIDTEQARPVNMPYAQENLVATYNGDNRMLSYNGQALSFDDDGNLQQHPLTGGSSSTLTYDTRNRLQSADGISYTYDPSGHRISKTVAGGGDPGTTTFVVNPNAALSQVLVREKPDGTITYYVYGLGLLYEQTGTEIRQYHSDLRGSTTVLTDGSGVVTDYFSYTPYGEMNWRSGNTDTPFLYNGKYGVQTDANGLLYMRARYYSPVLRRFINEDPAGFGGGMNFYAYANGNPISLIDPFGLGAKSAAGYQSSMSWGNPSGTAISEPEHQLRSQRALYNRPLLLGSNLDAYSDYGNGIAEANAIGYITAVPAVVSGGLLFSEAAGAAYIGAGNALLQNAPQINQFINGAFDGIPSVQGSWSGYGGVFTREFIINPILNEVD